MFRSAVPPRGVRRVASLLVAMTLLATHPVSAADLHVPGDHSTIQLAIDAAQPGDTVLVAPGTYVELIDFLGKSITVRAVDAPDSTIIDGGTDAPVVTFANLEGPDSVLEGFTIRNGAGGQNLVFDQLPGGILCDGASPTIRGNIIRDHSTYFIGAGVTCLGSNAVFEENTFLDNLSVADPFIPDIAGGRGAAIHVNGGAVTIRRNRFVGNTVGWRGGAVALLDTTGSILTGNIFEGNGASAGGAIAIEGNSNVTIENLLAFGNEAFPPACFCTSPMGRGGGIFVAETASASIEFATIVDNFITVDFGFGGIGGGIYAEPNASLSLTNSIVRGNLAPSTPQLNAILGMTYSNIEGTAPGTGNFDLDPLFVTGPFGIHYLSHVATGQPTDSPCVDAGNPSATAPTASSTRLDQGSDIGIVDIGFHYPVGLVFLRGDCNSDGQANIADAIFILNTLFPSPSTPVDPITCDDACDGNDSGTLNIADAIVILSSLFGASTVPLPPPTGPCGVDPTPDNFGCDVPPPC